MPESASPVTVTVATDEAGRRAVLLQLPEGSVVLDRLDALRVAAALVGAVEAL